MNSTDAMNGQTAQMEHRWSYLSAFLQDPDRAGALTDAQFLDLLRQLEREGVLPLFARRFHERPAYQALSPALRANLTRAVLQHMAQSASLWQEFEQVIGHLCQRGLHPMLIKGSHLALCYYEAAFLRPMADIDLLFTDLGEAERAYALLSNQGYLCRDPSRGGDRWLWSRHLPELQGPRAHHHIEIHGSVVYSPRDRRHLRERVLLEPLEIVPYGPYHLHAPCPEATIIFALAHEMVRHTADPPRMIVLQDVCTILGKLGPRFDWNRLLHLARKSGFADSTVSGLSAASQYLAARVPEGLLHELGQRDSHAFPSPRSALSQQAKLTQQELATFLHIGSPRLLVQKTLHMLFPSREYMRARYPEANGVLLFLLYPYRWLIQIAKVASLLCRPVASSIRPNSQDHPYRSVVKCFNTRGLCNRRYNRKTTLENAK